LKDLERQDRDRQRKEQTQGNTGQTGASDLGARIGRVTFSCAGRAPDEKKVTLFAG
jgi:hypothetical protein